MEGLDGCLSLFAAGHLYIPVTPGPPHGIAVLKNARSDIVVAVCDEADRADLTIGLEQGSQVRLAYLVREIPNKYIHAVPDLLGPVDGQDVL